MSSRSYRTHDADLLAGLCSAATPTAWMAFRKTWPPTQRLTLDGVYFDGANLAGYHLQDV